ncbi:hypothetical protein L226DRAFT_332046 [Lentinus tigrinus ALCF2SS1-7]|uniref:uncharacterized protein n=1 Tax=Lentinus tigrinus ALCF2SS1-7 TaxID=1328758 RepID=UPI001166036D|nr:hypothetical protein L226DRAFT_332046 [Lentinus tigrinus ALCF2SS1-7]
MIDTKPRSHEATTAGSRPAVGSPPRAAREPRAIQDDIHIPPAWDPDSRKKTSLCYHVTDTLQYLALSLVLSLTAAGALPRQVFECTVRGYRGVQALSRALRGRCSHGPASQPQIGPARCKMRREGKQERTRHAQTELHAQGTVLLLLAWLGTRAAADRLDVQVTGTVLSDTMLKPPPPSSLVMPGHRGALAACKDLFCASRFWMQPFPRPVEPPSIPRCRTQDSRDRQTDRQPRFYQHPYPYPYP